jgi:hypothetical protein
MRIAPKGVLVPWRSIGTSIGISFVLLHCVLPRRRSSFVDDSRAFFRSYDRDPLSSLSLCAFGGRLPQDLLYR